MSDHPENKRLPVWKRFLFSVLTLLGIIGFAELAGAIAMSWSGPRYEVIRGLLRGDPKVQVIHQQNSVGQAYLLYIPAPGFKSADGSLKHNRHGYRGPAVPLARTPGVARVLFMGGSTTYGWAVDDSSQTYPAQVGRMLNEGPLPPGIERVEVINAGLMWGTTAEILTHYAFKFRYYRPDVLVINTGGNDAQGSSLIDGYQPDYSHWRHSLPEIQPLRSPACQLMTSRLFSFVTIRLFFTDIANGSYFAVMGVNRRARTSWYERRGAGVEPLAQIPEEDLAFKNNLRSIIELADGDSVEVVLVPFRARPGNSYSALMKREMRRNEAILLSLADEYDLAVAHFPHELIAADQWVDDCHLDAEGSRAKAEHVETEVLRALRAAYSTHSGAAERPGRRPGSRARDGCARHAHRRAVPRGRRPCVRPARFGRRRGPSSDQDFVRAFDAAAANASK